MPRKANGRSSPSDGLEALREALISPDEPLPERRQGMVNAFEDAHATAAEPGEAVGMDMHPHLDPQESVSGGDPHVIELMRAVAKLAHAVRHHGEAGLRATPEMSRFEFTLRAYCAGYLAGRRAEEPPKPAVEETLPTDG